MTLLKINRLLPIYISIVPLKFKVDIQSQTKVRVRKQTKSNMAARRPFWKWQRWKSIGFCLWPPSTCIWNLKLKFQSKLDLCSGNHVVYRQTDGRTDGQTDRRTRWIQYTPPPTSLGGGIIIRGNSCIILYISMFGHQQYLTHELLPLVPTLTQVHISIHSDHTHIQWVVTILIQVYVSICLRHTQACILETTPGS